jgi:hypothetical protein
MWRHNSALRKVTGKTCLFQELLWAQSRHSAPGRLTASGRPMSEPCGNLLKRLKRLRQTKGRFWSAFQNQYVAQPQGRFEPFVIDAAAYTFRQ